MSRPNIMLEQYGNCLGTWTGIQANWTAIEIEGADSISKNGAKALKDSREDSIFQRQTTVFFFGIICTEALMYTL